MIQNLSPSNAEQRMPKMLSRIFILAWSTIIQIFCNPMKIWPLLVLVLLSLPLLSLAHIILPTVQTADAELISFDNHSMNISVKFDDLLGLFKGNTINFQNPFEHQIDIDAKQIFPNETLKREIISKSGPSEFTMPYLNYNLLGFNISATDIRVKANATQISGGGESDQSKKTRIDFPVMLADNVNVSNKATSQSFHNVDLSSIYAIYDPKTDKFTFHVPYSIAAKYLLKG